MSSEKKISDLNPVPLLDNSALFEIEQGGVSYKVDFNTIGGVVSINSDTTNAQNLLGQANKILIADDLAGNHTFTIGTDIVTLTDIQTLTNKTLTTPTIASFANATHDHSNAAEGGQLTNTALTAGVFAAITGIGTQSQTLNMNANLIQNAVFDNTNEFQDDALVIQNPANTFNYIIQAAAIITANRILNLPLITTTDTLAVLGLAQTFTATQTLNSFKGTGSITVTDILDEDDMVSDSATKLSTQQSIKKYVDDNTGGNTFARVVKKVDETVNNSNTLQADDELLFAASANKTYGLTLIFFCISSNAASFKYNLSLPAGATGDRNNTGSPSATGSVSDDVTNTEIVGSNSFIKIAAIYCRIIMGGTAGNVVMQWAQSIAEVSDTKVLQGSYLVVWEEIA